MKPAATPVYLITALAVSSTGARKMVQADVAPNPSSALKYGLYGTGTGCNDVSFTGNGMTDSFDGSQGPYDPGKNSSNTGGDVGSNGNVSLVGNTTIGGSIGVISPGPVVAGPCPPSNYTIGGANAGQAKNPLNVLNALPGPINYTAPPPPVPTPPVAPYNPPPCPDGSGQCMTPGTYGDISLSGKTTLTLAPGVYNVNTLSLSGQSSIVITPKGQVVLNIAGNCAVPCANPGLVLDLSGQSVNNQGFNANEFLINYGGNGSINVTGNASSTYFVLNAPNAAVQISGNGNIFGAVVGKTIMDVGNGGFHYDRSVSLAPPSTGALQLISFRHIPF